MLYGSSSCRGQYSRVQMVSQHGGRCYCVPLLQRRLAGKHRGRAGVVLTFATRDCVHPRSLSSAFEGHICLSKVGDTALSHDGRETGSVFWGETAYNYHEREFHCSFGSDNSSLSRRERRDVLLDDALELRVELRGHLALADLGEELLLRRADVLEDWWTFRVSACSGRRRPLCTHRTAPTRQSSQPGHGRGDR